MTKRKWTKSEIASVVRLHELWLRSGGAEGARADFSGANLSRSNLYGANLSRADFSGANLSCSNLFRANLEGANLSRSNLSRSNLSWSNLEGSNLEGANLSRADFSGANLSGSNLYGANLEGANLSRSNLSRSNLSRSDLSKIKAEFFEKLSLAKAEIPGLLNALKKGRIDGSCYEGDCCCFVGTVAKLAHEPYRELSCGLQANSDSLVEKWFLAIRSGDTPQNNPVAKITADWIDEFAEQRGIELT